METLTPYALIICGEESNWILFFVYFDLLQTLEIRIFALEHKPCGTTQVAQVLQETRPSIVLRNMDFAVAVQPIAVFLCSGRGLQSGREVGFVKGLSLLCRGR